jgi:hypothetical protein
MKTIEQIKADILATNPSRIYEINGEQFEQTDAKFNDAVQKRAEMEYVQQIYLEELKNSKLIKISAYRKLNLEDAEIIALMSLTAEEATLLLS